MMRTLQIMGLSILGVVALATPVAAAPQTVTDPCQVGAKQVSPAFHKRAPLHLDRDAAVQIITHVYRACRAMSDFVETERGMRPSLVSSFDAVKRKLRMRILDPIYGAYPDLRGQDFSAPALQEKHSDDAKKAQVAPHQRAMGARTAVRLRWAFSDLDGALSKLFQTNLCEADQTEKCVNAVGDISAELGFASASIYLSYPDLWKLKEKELLARMPSQPRTEKSDAAFRKAAPARGTVMLTPAAISAARSFLRAIRHKDPACQLIAIDWFLGGRSKGPNDADWKVTGPGLGLGTFYCKQVPPDVVQTIGGIRMIFGGDTAARFAGKLIDWDGKTLIFKDR